MNMPGFNAESSLGPTIGIYRGKAVFGRSGTGEVLAMQEFLVSSGLSQRIRAVCIQDACDFDCNARGAAIGQDWYGLCEGLYGPCVCKTLIVPNGGGSDGRGPPGGGGCTSDLQCPPGKICNLGQCQIGGCNDPDYVATENNLCRCFPSLPFCSSS